MRQHFALIVWILLFASPATGERFVYRSTSSDSIGQYVIEQYAGEGFFPKMIVDSSELRIAALLRDGTDLIALHDGEEDQASQVVRYSQDIANFFELHTTMALCNP